MFLLVAAQALVLNEVHVLGYGTPVIIVLLLAYMPMGAPRVPALLWAFTAGLLSDVFANTPGVCSGAMTFVALAQPALLKLTAPRDAAEDILPTYRSMGAWNHARYLLLLLLLFHAAYFLLESFSFYHLADDTLNTLVSWALSALVVLPLERLRGNGR